MEKPSNIPEAPNINSTTENSKAIEHTTDIEKKLKISFNNYFIFCNSIFSTSKRI